METSFEQPTATAIVRQINGHVDLKNIKESIMTVEEPDVDSKNNNETSDMKNIKDQKYDVSVS